jgi:hypothetical protein
LWETHRGRLVRLKTAAKDYGNLTVNVLDQGGGKDSWRNNEDRLLLEIASVIDRKPAEPWLVIHHGDACQGKFPQALRSSINSDASRVSFVSWGKHQGTNDYAGIPNIVLAGTLFLPEGQYQGLAYVSSGTSVHQELPEEMVQAIRLGEHSDLILQGLCRASVRGSDGSKCRPCNAYIIASKGSGIRKALSKVFPGCRVTDWKPMHKPMRGKVADAVAHAKGRLKSDPQAVITFVELMKVTGCSNKANFNRSIRRHTDFVTAMDHLGLVEVASNGSRHIDALQRRFGPDPEVTDIGDV